MVKRLTVYDHLTLLLESRILLVERKSSSYVFTSWYLAEIINDWSYGHLRLARDRLYSSIRSEFPQSQGSRDISHQ